MHPGPPFVQTFFGFPDFFAICRQQNRLESTILKAKTLAISNKAESCISKVPWE